jgi:Xaa-Pro aminopeptidase
VHEGPQGIGQRIAYNDIPLAEGHVVSNEPGYYADGKWGIRIENVVVCCKKETRWDFGERGYLGFERLTMVSGVATGFRGSDLQVGARRGGVRDGQAFERKGGRGTGTDAQCSIQTKLVNKDLLSPDERRWLDEYHAEVREKVMPVLRGFGDERAIAWLEKECRAL